MRSAAIRWKHEHRGRDTSACTRFQPKPLLSKLVLLGGRTLYTTQAAAGCPRPRSQKRTNCCNVGRTTAGDVYHSERGKN